MAGQVDRRRAERGLRAALLLPLVLATSCMVGPNYRTPKSNVADAWLPPPVPVPSPAPAPAPAPPPLNPVDAYWWKVFRDPILDQLVEAAFQNNLSVQIAGVRVLQARAQLNQAIGNLFPQQQGLSGGIDWQQVNKPMTVNAASDNLLFSATWEIDVWGKIRRGIESDEATYLGAIASYDDVLVTTIADVASTYVRMRTAEERIRVAERNVETQRESLRVASVQYAYGESSELDVRQAEALLAQTEAQIPQLRNTVRQSRNALGVLLGETPPQIEARFLVPGTIPVADVDAATGIPRDLLRRRPDVRAAGLAAASQSALIGVAVAAMYPSFSLSGAFGLRSSNQFDASLGDLFAWPSRVFQAGASFFFPILNYGRLVNQVRVQDAGFQAAVLNYQNVVLAAQREVEDGLSALVTSRAAADKLAGAARSAERASYLSLLQYKAGETPYTTVVTAEQSELTIEDALANARGNAALGLVSVYRALGGGWEIRGDRDLVPDAVKEEMARRTNWGDMLEIQNHMPAKSPVEEP